MSFNIEPEWVLGFVFPCLFMYWSIHKRSEKPPEHLPLYLRTCLPYIWFLFSYTGMSWIRQTEYFTLMEQAIMASFMSFGLIYAMGLHANHGSPWRKRYFFVFKIMLPFALGFGLTHALQNAAYLYPLILSAMTFHLVQKSWAKERESKDKDSDLVKEKTLTLITSLNNIRHQRSFQTIQNQDHGAYRELRSGAQSTT